MLVGAGPESWKHDTPVGRSARTTPYCVTAAKASA